ncbi:RsiV family protein [Metabacillus niabensis]|uniref:RsiV family protein n=1 Tax=Metabacillus niabensis TaxID=324854 RepID=UPI001CFB255B|nr:RsiV family protein [Metabacillus niabensis]
MSFSLPVATKTVKISSAPKKTVVYPRVVRMRNQHLQTYINQIIVYTTQQLIDQQVGNMPSTVEEMLGEYEIKNNQRQVLSLSLSNYTYHEKAAHGLTIIKSLTFDLNKGKFCNLKDLFKPGIDYIKTLSSIIQAQIKERDIPILNGFTSISPDQEFYMADKALVIYFQLYDITPYAFGFPMFPISVYEIQDIIDENGPLGRMGVNN